MSSFNLHLWPTLNTKLSFRCYNSRAKLWKCSAFQNVPTCTNTINWSGMLAHCKRATLIIWSWNETWARTIFIMFSLLLNYNELVMLINRLCVLYLLLVYTVEMICCKLNMFYIAIKCVLIIVLPISRLCPQRVMLQNFVWVLFLVLKLIEKSYIKLIAVYAGCNNN